MTKYIWTVALSEKVPNITTQRRNRHWMIVHAEDKASAEKTAHEAAERVGVVLLPGDIIAIHGGTRRA